MARGKKTDTLTVYKIMLSVFSTNNFSETARNLNIPEKTVETIYKKNIDKEEFAKLRQEKREEFIDKATRIVNKGAELIERKLTLALEQEEVLEILIDEVMGIKDDDIKYKEKVNTIKKISKLQLNNLSELTTTVGIIYDKKILLENNNNQDKTNGNLLNIANLINNPKPNRSEEDVQ